MTGSHEFHSKINGDICQSPSYVGIQPLKEIVVSKFISFAFRIQQRIYGRRNVFSMQLNPFEEISKPQQAGSKYDVTFCFFTRPSIDR